MATGSPLTPGTSVLSPPVVVYSPHSPYLSPHSAIDPHPEYDSKVAAETCVVSVHKCSQADVICTTSAIVSQAAVNAPLSYVPRPGP